MTHTVFQTPETTGSEVVALGFYKGLLGRAERGKSLKHVFSDGIANNCSLMKEGTEATELFLSLASLGYSHFHKISEPLI